MKYRDGVARFLASERASSLVLIPTGVLALLLGHWNLLGFLEDHLRFLGVSLSLREWVTVGPLALFFYVAGVEIRATLFQAESRSEVPVAVLAAAFGMLAPAVLYLVSANVFDLPNQAWGVPMATDLPLALAALTLMRPKRLTRLRKFLLLLAIADDLGTIVVIAVKFHESYRLMDIGLLVLTMIAFGLVARNKKTPAIVLIAFGLIGWAFAVRSGFHPTVIAVVFGLLTSTKWTEPVLKKIEPISSFIAVPIFIFCSLGISITWPRQDLQGVVWALVVVRIIGKPVGILIGIWIGEKLAPKFHMNLGERVLIGVVGCFGFSVSLLFAQLALTEAVQSAAILAVVITLPVAAALASGYYFFTKATAA